jgi:hypothetical protein
MVVNANAEFIDRLLELAVLRARVAGVLVTDYMAGIVDGRFPPISRKEFDSGVVDPATHESKPGGCLTGRSLKRASGGGEGFPPLSRS